MTSDYLAYADSRTFRRFDALAEALEWASAMDGKVYMPITQQAEIERLQAENVRLREALRGEQVMELAGRFYIGEEVYSDAT